MKKLLLLVLICLVTSCYDITPLYDTSEGIIRQRFIYNKTDFDSISFINGKILPPGGVLIINSPKIPYILDTIQYPLYFYFYNENCWTSKNEFAWINLY